MIQAPPAEPTSLADILFLFLAAIALVAVGASLAAAVLLCNVLFPSLVARTRQNAERMPVRSFFVGLLNFIFFGLLALAFLSGDQGAKLLGAILLLVLFSFVMLGVAALARLVGERLRPDEPDTVRQWLAGILLLELATLLPAVGWFVIPPLAGLIGYGATLIALIWRNDEQEVGEDRSR